MSNLLIYQSSAGSGKTYTLAKEYLKLAFKYPGAFKSILAITFTNKATEEMKSRVLTFLIELANEQNKELKKQLEDEGVKGNPAELAKITLNSILHNYSDFSISTIDSFFNRILRSFAKELKLQMGYEIELDNGEVLDEITEMLLMDLKDDEELKKHIGDFVLEKISEDKGWDIERDIKKLGNEIFKERYWEKKFKAFEQSGAKDIGDSRKKVWDLIKDLNNVISEFQSELKKIGDEAENVMRSFGLEIGDFAYGDTGAMGFLLDKIRQKREYDITKARVKKAYEENDGWFSKSSKKKDVINSAVEGGLYDLLKKAFEYIQSESPKYNTAKELKSTIYIFGILEDLNSKLNEFRKEKKKLLQSDVNSLLQGLISEDNSPFIYEKIGSNYRNILIDEFQDTSTFQWKNLLPLIINVLSEKNTSLVVGDVKQSIYRWRSGNMKLLLSQIYEDLSAFSEIINTEYMKTNRRSRKEIVNFNNRFFADAVEKITDGIQDEDYKNLIYKAYEKDSLEQNTEKEGGYVSVDFFEENKDEGTKAKDNAEKKVPEIIEEVLKDGYSRSDILVLVRRNEEARSISGVISDAGHNIISTESLMVYNSPKVRLVVNLVKYICDNKNKLAKTEVLYNYFRIKNLKIEFAGLFENIDELFIKEMPLGFFKENEAPKIKPVLNDVGIYEVIENLLKIFRFDKEADPFLMKFLDIVLELSEEFGSDLVSFIDKWEEKKNDYSIDSPEGADAVRIMTIHKAKGLQGKIIIVPYANWEINISGRKDFIWVSSEKEPFDKYPAYAVKAVTNLANTFFANDYNYEFAQTRLDNLNLLYVTLTRAENRLYVLVPERTNSENIGTIINETIKKYEGYYDGKFEIGKKDIKIKQKEEKVILSEQLSEIISNEWYKKTIIKPKHRQVRTFSDKEFAFKINKGIILHEVLSRIKVKEDADEAIERVIYDGMLNREEKENIKSGIEKILNDTEASKWFGGEWDVKTEKDILVGGGSILRPDRVLIKGKSALLIDYKTGKEKDEHKKQILKYAETLKCMGFEEINNYLLYINDDGEIKITEVAG